MDIGKLITEIVCGYALIAIFFWLGLDWAIPRTDPDIDEGIYTHRRTKLIMVMGAIWPATALIIVGSTIPPVRAKISAYLNRDL